MSETRVPADKSAHFVRPPTAQEAVLAALRRSISSGELAPGSPIQQVAVAESMGVSRVPVREALKILEGEGHVIYEPHRGYAVAQLDATDLQEIYRLRELLETMAVEQAAPKFSADLAERMERLVVLMDDAIGRGSAAELSDYNRRFHFALIEASERPRLVKTLEQLWDSSDPYRGVDFTDVENRTEVQREYRLIIEAVRAKDVVAVVGLLHQHRMRACVSVTDGLRTQA